MYIKCTERKKEKIYFWSTFYTEAFRLYLHQKNSIAFFLKEEETELPTKFSLQLLTTLTSFKT